jgi:DNA-directed RNA polymerase sigma subunit (sigma70/sigma32)
MASKRLTVAQRREIFQTLVATQDEGQMSVPQSLEHVSKQFDITDAQIRQIQDEGIEKQWPPLDEVVTVVN